MNAYYDWPRLETPVWTYLLVLGAVGWRPTVSAKAIDVIDRLLEGHPGQPIR